MKRVRVIRFTESATTSRVTSITGITSVTTGRAVRLPLLAQFVLLLLVLVPVGAARADTVDYSQQGTFTQTTPLSVGGLTATPGTGQTLDIYAYGLGVEGGFSPIYIDESDSVRFSFDAGAATGVSFSRSDVLQVSDAPMILEGFDASGASLGTVGFHAIANLADPPADPPVNVSALFGGVPLSGFKISGNGSATGLTVWKVTFTPLPPDTTPPTITATASKSVLWPPTGLAVPVVVTGTITDNAGGSGIDLSTVCYTVVDEYGQNQPAGAITLASDGSYSFTVKLPASRLDTDLNGRTFTITVMARDMAGNAASKSVVVTVPHDQSSGKQ
jgi:hypothetical protein